MSAKRTVSNKRTRGPAPTSPTVTKPRRRRPRPELDPAYGKACDVQRELRRAGKLLALYVSKAADRFTQPPVTDTAADLFRVLAVCELRAGEVADELEDLGCCDRPKEARHA